MQTPQCHVVQPLANGAAAKMSRNEFAPLVVGRAGTGGGAGRGAAGGRSPSFFSGAIKPPPPSAFHDDGATDGGAGASGLRRAFSSARAAAAGYGTLSGAGGDAVYKGLHSSVTIEGAREWRGTHRACLCPCGRVSARLGLLLTLVALAGFAGVAAIVGYYVAPGFVSGRITASTLVFEALELSAPVAEGEPPLDAAWAASSAGALRVDAAAARALRQLAASVRGGDLGPDAGAAAEGATSAVAMAAGAAGNWGFTLSVRGVLSGLSPVGGTLASFGATMLQDGVTIATFQMPELSASAGVDNSVGFSAPVRIASLAAFAAFGNQLVNGEGVSVTLRGRTSVAAVVAGLRVVIEGVDFEKTVRIGGARGLPGASVASFSLTRSNATRALADLVVSVPNPSIVTISPLGDVALRLFFEGADVGYALARNASLVGSAVNNLTLEGVIASDNATATGRLISAYLGGRPAAIQAIGDGGSSALYAPVIAALQLTAELAGSSAPLISSVAVIGMYLRPMGAESVGIDLNVTVSIVNPLGAASPILVSAVALNCSLQGEGQMLGDLVVPTTPVLGSGGGGGALLGGRGALLGDALENITLQLSATLALETSNSRFSDFVLAFLQRSSVSLGLVSNATNAMVIDLSCALGVLQVTIPLEVQTQVNGIGGFPSVELRGFAVAGTRDLPQPAVVAALNVSLFNPSPAAFPLGAAATLGLYAGGQRLGQSVILNGTLEPGENLLSIEGVLAPQGGAALSSAAALFSSYLAGANSTVTVVGEDVVMPGGAATPAWLLGAVRNISLAATLPGLPAAVAAALLANLTVGGLDLDFGERGELAEPLVSGSVLAVLRLPFAVAAAVEDLDLDLRFVEAASGLPIAAISLKGLPAAWLPCNTTASCDAVLRAQMSALPGGVAGCSRPREQPLPAEPGLGRGLGLARGDSSGSRVGETQVSDLVPVGVLSMTLTPTALGILDAAGFSRLLSAVLANATVALGLAGTASPRVTLNIGTLALTGVAVNQVVELQGMGGFLDPPVVVTQGELFNTSSTGVDLFVNFNLTNPAPISGRLGPITLGIEYNGANFITATLNPFVVTRGVNERTAAGRFQPKDARVDPVNNALAREALSRYLRGIDTPITVRGSAASSPNPLIAAALQSFTSAATFPGNPVPLIVNGTLMLAGLYVRPSDNKTFVPGVLVSDNTLAVNLQITRASLFVYLCDGQTSSTECTGGVYTNPIGFFSEAGDLERAPIKVPAKSIFASQPYNITLVASVGSLATIGVDTLFYGNILGKLSGNLTTALSGVNGSEPFELETFYEQELLKLVAN